jgi:hypothetical protein
VFSSGGAGGASVPESRGETVERDHGEVEKLAPRQRKKPDVLKF